MTKEISTSLQEDRQFEPTPNFQASALIQSTAQYDAMYQRSISDPEGFWAEQAQAELNWFKPWDKVLEWDFDSIGTKDAPYVSWFSGGKLNASFNCLDRHLEALGEKTAIIWQGENEAELEKITYRQLHTQVCRFANVLKKHGVKKGDTVTIFLPMILELPVAMLACARIGAIHSVVFSAFSAESLHSRIVDCNSTFVVTSDVSFHHGKTVALKDKVDTALLQCPDVRKVIVVNRGKSSPAMLAGRDLWWDQEINAGDISADCPAAEQDAEDPLFALYTSGSTGKPKGVMHTTAGYLLYTHLTFKYIFDYRQDDIFWCTADAGWITGHSYLVYGPLSNGATVVMFEGTPTYPTPDRFWSIVAKYKITIFYTAPTAIRSLMRLGAEWPDKHDLSSLRILGSVGEPINPEAWIWYQEVIGKGNCPVVDTWWQTETGGHMITTFPGAHLTKPGSAGKPFFGVYPEVLRNDGTPTQDGEGGQLFITRPWPGMLRGVFGDTKNELIKKVYFTMQLGKYFTGDGCRIDKDGYYWLLGRIDDVINVSGHRFATAEIESALVGHSSVAEAAVVGYPHEIKGQGLYCFVTLKQGIAEDETLRKALIKHVRDEIGPIATPDCIHFAPALPKTRSGKIMRRILRKIAEGAIDQIGDTSTLADPTVVETLVATRANV